MGARARSLSLIFLVGPPPPPPSPTPCELCNFIIPHFRDILAILDVLFTFQNENEEEE